MRFHFLKIALSLLIGLTGGLPSATQSAVAIAPAQKDWAAFLGSIPKAGSDEVKADLAILLWTQRTRTADGLKRAQAEVKLVPRSFSEALGKDLDPKSFPLTTAILDDLAKDVKSVTDPLKQKFARPRPYDADSRVLPAISRESSFSFPSGHATRGVAISIVLAELAPGCREALLEYGRQVGVNRVVGGVHYPSDIEAGQRLGAELARIWLAEPTHRTRLEAARAAEWAGTSSKP